MVSETTVLLVTDAVVLPASTAIWAMKKFEDNVASGKSLGLATQATNITGILSTNFSSLEVLISITQTPGFHTVQWLVEAAKILRPGGTLFIQEPICAPHISSAPEEGVKGDVVLTETSLLKNLLLAGFMQSESCEALQYSQEGLPSILSGDGSTLQPIMIKAQKPEWEMGSSFLIKKLASIPDVGLPRESQVEFIHDGSTNGLISFSVLVPETEAEELVDEDALLTEDDLAKPVTSFVDVDDCEMGNSGKKACKNCTCGRAEAEKKGGLTAEQLQNPQSACGNCGLGDAFRCGSCLYRGLPPFRLGEKITLPGGLLTADI